MIVKKEVSGSGSGDKNRTGRLCASEQNKSAEVDGWRWGGCPNSRLAMREHSHDFDFFTLCLDHFVLNRLFFLLFSLDSFSLLVSSCCTGRTVVGFKCRMFRQVTLTAAVPFHPIPPIHPVPPTNTTQHNKMVILVPAPLLHLASRVHPVGIHEFRRFKKEIPSTSGKVTDTAELAKLHRNAWFA